MGALQGISVTDPFDDPDITILTNDPDASWAVWDMSNGAEEGGEKSFELSEKLERSLDLQRVHELWIVVNDGLKSGVLLLGLYAAFKALKPRDGRHITIRFGGRVQISKDDQDRFHALGIELIFEKTETDRERLNPPTE